MCFRIQCNEQLTDIIGTSFLEGAELVGDLADLLDVAVGGDAVRDQAADIAVEFFEKFGLGVLLVATAAAIMAAKPNDGTAGRVSDDGTAKGNVYIRVLFRSHTVRVPFRSHCKGTSSDTVHKPAPAKKRAEKDSSDSSDSDEDEAPQRPEKKQKLEDGRAEVYWAACWIAHPKQTGAQIAQEPPQRQQPGPKRSRRRTSPTLLITATQYSAKTLPPNCSRRSDQPITQGAGDEFARRAS